jgi:Fe-S-cluster-containing dehydrogenase component
MNAQVQTKINNIFIFDKNKCVGCQACSVACMNENGFQAPEKWRNVHSSNPAHFPDIPLFYLSIACNHCDDAPCMKNCPANAYSRDKKTGAVIHHAEKCIGCKYCTWACPYDAPKYYPNKGIVEKCTFCNHRLAENEKPACAQLCPTGALDFSFDGFSPEESKLSSPVAVDIGAHLKKVELRNPAGAEIDSALFSNLSRHNMENTKNEKITAKKEWPLVIFTLISAFLVAIYITSPRLPVFHPAALIGVAFFAGVLSLIHLGKKKRAWRAVLNLKNSWLSREIFAFGLFFILMVIDYLIYPVPVVLIAFVGFILLFSIDKLYHLATWNWPIKLHQAQTLWIAASAWFLLEQNLLFFLGVAVARIAIFVMGTLIQQGAPNPGQTLRFLFLLIISFGLAADMTPLFLWSLFIAGETMDRIAFYNQLEVPGPTSEIIRTQKN